jgi:hypothetical protein
VTFSAIADLPDMYRHCKATEHADMTPLDFITDHLINIDGIFDKHDNGDDQKPHSPFTFHHPVQQVFFSHYHFELTFLNYVNYTVKKIYHHDNFLPSKYISNIFRPPIV